MNTRKILILAIILILLSVVGFHLLLPLLGIVIAISATAWIFIVASVVFFSVSSLLFFLLPGILILLLSAFALGWVIVALVLFPFIFPIIMPIFIILLVIAYITQQKKKRDLK